MRTCPLVVNLRTSANAHKAVQGAEGKQTKTKLCIKRKKKKKKKDKAPYVRLVAREWSVLSDLPGIRALIPRGTSHMKSRRVTRFGDAPVARIHFSYFDSVKKVL